MDEWIIYKSFYYIAWAKSMQDYQLLSKIGSGSFGVVHKARDKKNNLICVVKIVDISNMNAKLRKSAMDEGKILKEVNSPFIVKHFNTFIHKSTLNIVMEYCPKGDLTGYMKAQMGKPLKEETIWKFSIQMLSGLRDLHRKKILHRDIKSLNIFLDENCNAKIGDLGVAKTLTSEFAHTIVGTPYYLSPEMCEQKPYNQKTDIWAIGCVIYQLCTGRRPFEANNQAALALKIVMGKYDNLPSHLSQDLVWIVKSCLSVDYKRRPTAAYLLGMPKTKQWAAKLNIQIDPSQNKINKAEVKEIPKEKQQKIQFQDAKIVKDQPDTPKQKKEISNQNEKNKQKQKEAERKKISKDGEKNVQEVLNNKVSFSSKPVQYSGAKRLQIMLKEKKEQEKEKVLKEQEQKYLEQNQQKEKEKQDVKSKDARKQKDQRLKYLKKHTQKSDEKGEKKVMERQYISQPSFAKDKDIENAKDRKSKLVSTTTNRFLPQNYRKKRQIDLEDESKIEQVQLFNSESSEEEQGQKSTKKNEFFHNFQQVVDDQQLMKQFQLNKPESPKKELKQEKSEVSNFKLDKKPISINWNNQLQTPSEREKIKNKSSLLDEIPTVRTKSTLELEILPQMKICEEFENSEQIDEQINQNRPYISDEEDETSLDQEQFLIQDMDQKEQDLVQKLKENQKRKGELQRMKKHFQPELIKMMSKAEYEKLKMKIMDCREDEVEGFVQGWKGNIEGMNLFYRIIHFDMEIRRCEANLKQIEQKLEQIQKQKN